MAIWPSIVSSSNDESSVGNVTQCLIWDAANFLLLSGKQVGRTDPSPSQPILGACSSIWIINLMPVGEASLDSSRRASNREFCIFPHSSMRGGGAPMLLQRLREYAETREDLPPAMYQTVFIRYVLQLSNQGEPLALIDLATQQQKRGLQKKAPDCVRSSGDR